MRSEIFATTDDQRHIAEETIADVDASGLWPGKVVTEVSESGAFWQAEPEHQELLPAEHNRGYVPLRATGLEAATPSGLGLTGPPQSETRF